MACSSSGQLQQTSLAVAEHTGLPPKQPARRGRARPAEAPPVPPPPGALVLASSQHEANRARGHQRRQSVARLLPDISRLRLLSWLLEASSELLTCDIAIMDGVYAKLQRSSQESLLFWQPHQDLAASASQRYHSLPPALQSVASSGVVAASAVAVDDDELDDDGADSSSSASSSGVHSSSASSTEGNTGAGAGGSSLSPAGSRHNLSLQPVAPARKQPAVPTREPVGLRLASSNQQQQQQQQQQQHHDPELISDKIRRTVAEHNYLQGLVVNVIRQHDRRLAQLNQALAQGRPVASQLGYINLAELAESLDDCCNCQCHQAAGCRLAAAERRAASLPAGLLAKPARKRARRLRRPRAHQQNHSDEGPALERDQLLELLSDRLCDSCLDTHRWLHGDTGLLEKIRQLAEEANSADEPTDHQTPTGSSKPINRQQATVNGELESHQQSEQQHKLNDDKCAKANANFIKLVQQHVRSNLNESIELIDLIRKERIKSPEFIKQRQLLRCFQNSVQLLTSVANYVVPSQDISSFVPELGGQPGGEQVAPAGQPLYCLPTADFEQHYHPGQPLSSYQLQPANYHLAAAAEAPIRRRASGILGQLQQTGQQLSRLQLNASGGASSTGNSSAGGSSSSSASSSISRSPLSGGPLALGLQRARTAGAILTTGSLSQPYLPHHGLLNHQLNLRDRLATEPSLSLPPAAHLHHQHQNHQSQQLDLTGGHLNYNSSQQRFWNSSKFNFLKKLLQVKQQRLLRQQSKDRRIYNHKVQNKFRLVMMDLTHFNKSQQLLSTENGLNSLLASMRNVLEFGLYLTVKLY